MLICGGQNKMLFSRVENVFCVLDKVETWGALYGRFRVPKSRMIVLRRRISTQTSGRSSCFSTFIPARILYLLSAREHLAGWSPGWSSCRAEPHRIDLTLSSCLNVQE
jgi:hypothetical protein